MTKYQKLLAQILQGDVAEASEVCHEARKDYWPANDESLERQLIAFRVALKAGNSQIPVENLREDSTHNLFLKAEVLFFKGSYYGQFYEHDRAAVCFEKAAKFYLDIQEKEKSLLSDFNSKMALLNDGKIKSNEANEIFQKILSISLGQQNKKVEFLCRRQISYLYFEKKQFKEAIQIIEETICSPQSLTRSDLDLVLVHLADCYLESGDLRKAINYIDQVSSAPDARIEFPKAFISGKIFRTPVEIKKFKSVSTYWQKRYILSVEDKIEEIKAPSLIQWDKKSGRLWKQKQLLGKVKPHSLEGQLLKLLTVAPRTKSYLCESLWPGELYDDYLSDRFHQLVLRVNRKIKNLIIYDGQFYQVDSMKQFKF